MVNGKTTPDYIVQADGNIISPLSKIGAGNATVSNHMQSLLRGYNPRHYGYCNPVPINVEFICWNKKWIVKQSTLGKDAGLGLFAAQDIVVRRRSRKKVARVLLLPYSGPVYRRPDWSLIAHEWPHMGDHTMCANSHSVSHYTLWQYIDGTPSYTWCVAGYINSGINHPETVNVDWEESRTRDLRLHKDTRLLQVWSVATN
jgi:hypothetical protein